MVSMSRSDFLVTGITAVANLELTAHVKVLVCCNLSHFWVLVIAYLYSVHVPQIHNRYRYWIIAI